MTPEEFRELRRYAYGSYRASAAALGRSVSRIQGWETGQTIPSTVADAVRAEVARKDAAVRGAVPDEVLRRRDPCLGALWAAYEASYDLDRAAGDIPGEPAHLPPALQLPGISDRTQAILDLYHQRRAELAEAT